MLQVRALVEEPRSTLTARQRRAFILLPALALLHTLLAWGYTGLFWGEHGRWLHEVARYAAGEVPYRDFTWQGPPLALWVVGGIAKLTGSGLAAVSATMSLVFIAVVLLYLHVLRQLIPSLVLAISLPAFLFAIAYAHRTGVPLPLGTAAPDAPIGFLCLLGAVSALVAAIERPVVWRGVLAGGLLALTFLSRSDFWLSGVYLLAVGTAVQSRRGVTGAPRAAPLVACLVVAAAGLLLAAARAGVYPVIYSQLRSLAALALWVVTPPALERLTVDIAAAAAVALTAVTALWLCLAISDRSAARWAGLLLCLFLTSAAVHLGMSVAVANVLQNAGPDALPTMSEEAIHGSLVAGRGAVSAAVAFFDERFQAHLFPYILPPILLGVVLLRWSKWYDPALRTRLALLLGLAVVARAHRPSFGPAWYNVFIELPAYALFFLLLCGPDKQKAARAIRAALSILILLGAYTYVSLARGPGTLHGLHPKLDTPAGTVRWPLQAISAWQRADSAIKALDPSGGRPVFAFGSTGGWSYFLGRPNPVGATGGLTAGLQPPDSIVARLRTADPPVILIDNRYMLPAVAAMGLRSSWLRWEPMPEQNPYVRLERGAFLELRSGCAEVGADTTQAIRVFDCERRSM